MDEINFQDGIDQALDSLFHQRLALLVGAGLSMAPPSSLPSAATIAGRAKHRYDALYGNTRPPLAPGIEEQAEFFLARHELDTAYFQTFIDVNAFAGPPNSGHFAAADLILVQAIPTAITTNVDFLVETAGQLLCGHVEACLDGHQVATLPPGKPWLLKIHGCRMCDRPNMVWARGQIGVPPISVRIARSTTLLNAGLLGKDLLIVGYWTDWDYLNAILAATLGAVAPAQVIVVDTAASADFKAKAPELYALGIRATTSFTHVRASGADFLDALRLQFSKSIVRRALHAGEQDFVDHSGNRPDPAWLEPPAWDNQTLWQVRRDIEGCLPNEPSKAREPPNEPLLGLTLLQLQAKGAIADGPYWTIGMHRVRVLRAAGKLLHRVQLEYEGEVPPIVAPDIIIAVGAEAQLLPTHVVRAGTAPTIARGAAGKWLARTEAVAELDL